MAVKSKVQLAADIAASTFTSPQQVILDDMVDSYQDLSQGLTTVQIAAIPTPASGQLVYNTDLSQFQYYNGATWVGLGQKQIATVIISSAQLLNSFTSPVTLITGVSGLTIIPTHIVRQMTFNSVAYATHVDGYIAHAGNTETKYLTDLNMAIAGGVNSSSSNPANSISDNNVLIQGADLIFSIRDGNPTAGNSSLILHIEYYYI